MTAAFLAVAELDLPFALALMLVRGEETKSVGTAEVVAEWARRGLVPALAVVGEPTGLDFAVAQKGLLVLELLARGEQHAAHARTLGARNAIVSLACDLAAIAGLPELPARPVSPGAPRSNRRSSQAARQGTSCRPRRGRCSIAVPYRSSRPRRTSRAAACRRRGRARGALRPLGAGGHRRFVTAGRSRAARATDGAHGSATLSDLTFFRGIPAMKVGPSRRTLASPGRVRPRAGDRRRGSVLRAPADRAGARPCSR